MNQHGYTVGEVAKLVGIPKDTLLYYDRIDLFKPAYVDEKTRYRYYAIEQFWKLDIIRCCRNLGIPIETIRIILACKDNQTIVNLLKEYRSEALSLSRYYQQVYDDICWYEEQYQLVRKTPVSTEVSVVQEKEKYVFYADNPENIRDYHSQLMGVSKDVLERKDSFRRDSGFIMDPDGLKTNTFMKLGEYAVFSDEVMKQFRKDEMKVLPGGEYATCTVTVFGRSTDFSKMNRWLKKHHVQPELVLMEEVGFQMFYYFWVNHFFYGIFLRD